MISRKLTDRFKVVYVHDPALLVFSDSEIADYQNSGCDLSKLDLNKCTEKPTIFECLPLKPEFHYLMAQRETIPLAVYWQVFKHHVVAAQNCIDEKGEPLLKWTSGGTPAIDDDCNNAIDNDVLEYVASCIIAKAGNPVNFPTVQGGFWVAQARSRLRHAKAADARNVDSQSPAN